MNATTPMPPPRLPVPMLEVVYAPTSRGEEALRGGKTRMPMDQLALLVRFDGRLSLAQIGAGLPQLAPESFLTLFQALRDAGLLELQETDLFQMQLDAQLQNSRMASGLANVDASVVSLRREGYYVEIARERAGRPAARAAALDIVVVEDEPVLARFIKTYLSLDGAQVRLAGNRAEVSAELSKRPVPDLILLDVVLPDADGFDILHRVRQHALLKDVPVVMLTGKATRESVLKGIAGGADGYVTKPFLPEALVRAARTCLGLPEDCPGADPWANGDAKSLKWQFQAAA